MCITFIKLSPNQKNKFLIGFNREVEITKPTKAACFWPSDPNILGGLDLVLGGSCLAFNVVTGHVAILTNYAELPAEEKFRFGVKSRGDLVRNWVQTDFFTSYNWSAEEAALKYIEMVKMNRKNYNPFNLIVGSLNDPELRFYGLDFVSEKPVLCEHNKFFGMSNSSFECPYLKLTKGLEFLNDPLSHEDDILRLEQVLGNKTHYKWHENFDPEDTILVDPFYASIGRILGTITTTIISVDKDNNFELKEVMRTFPHIRFDYDQKVSHRRKLRRVMRKIKSILHMAKANSFPTTTTTTVVKGIIPFPGN